MYRFCVNALCKTTGTYVHNAGDPNMEDCSSPLVGRYLTIQRILTVAASLSLSEIDIVFFQPYADDKICELDSLKKTYYVKGTKY